MKYVMFRKQMTGMNHYIPIIFPNTGVHADVAEAFAKIPGMEEYKPVSAGEIVLGFDVNCFGESTTLNLDADPERDSNIVAMNDYGGAFE